MAGNGGAPKAANDHRAAAYYSALGRVVRSSGGNRAQAISQASKLRRRMISNPGNSYDGLLTEVRRTQQGRKGLARYKKFWGLKNPVGIEKLNGPKNLVLVGAGNTPGVYLSECDRNQKGCRTWSVKGRKKVAFTTDGRQVVILGKGSQKNFGKNLKFVGYARETHYVPTAGMEKAGTFKKGVHWVHKHDDEGGRYPKVFKDAAGNHIYARGTLRITDWMRR